MQKIKDFVVTTKTFRYTTLNKSGRLDAGCIALNHITSVEVGDHYEYSNVGMLLNTRRVLSIQTVDLRKREFVTDENIDIDADTIYSNLILKMGKLQ